MDRTIRFYVQFSSNHSKFYDASEHLLFQKATSTRGKKKNREKVSEVAEKFNRANDPSADDLQSIERKNQFLRKEIVSNYNIFALNIQFHLCL